MPIIIGERYKYHDYDQYRSYDELKTREISLYELFELEIAEWGQTEKSAAILKKLVDLTELMLESSPNGQKHLKNYIEMTSVPNVEYREGIY